MARPRKQLFELRGQMSRSQVAKAIGITTQMLGMIERGQRSPSLALAKKISDFYGRSVDELFFEDDRHVSLPSNHTA
ncbi:helix-turn-helix transcriptional regulator [Alicyclobacillus tolerans]|uniref:helix-turn-helix transcriptional regulator n=1 Tax=Alicyclobacillus tolerans TaxID=90970 RepID=UPI003B7E81A7